MAFTIFLERRMCLEAKEEMRASAPRRRLTGHRPSLLSVLPVVWVYLLRGYSMVCCLAANLHDNPCNGNEGIFRPQLLDIETQKPYSIYGIYGTKANHPGQYPSHKKF
jgi:hypothetical protein